MYESYALLQPADGIVSGGHVRMAKEPAVVVRNADGTINGKESYCVFVEQGCYCSSAAHTRTQPDGTSYQIQGNDNLKVSFEDLVSSYLPFTFAEFLGTDPVEKGEVTIGLTGESASVRDLSLATLKSNYPWSDIFFTITDPEGTEVFRRIQRSENHYSRTAYFGKYLLISAVSNMIKPFAAKGGHTVTVEVQISTGEKLVAYSGLLTE
jgi:hypothetical protein